jgi:hypothetical protein
MTVLIAHIHEAPAILDREIATQAKLEIGSCREGADRLIPPRV